MTDTLPPPHQDVEDPGAKELTESSDEHFSDASEGQPTSSDITIPITRVERVDDEPAHGEVPGTDAYKMRTQDAVPDEVEIVPDGQRSRSASRVSGTARPVTPGGSPIPKTVIEKVDDQPSYGDVPGTHAHQLRLADAEPDIIVKAPEPPQRKGSPTAASDRLSLNSSNDVMTQSIAQDDKFPESQFDIAGHGDDFADDDGFGDFDDFEEGEDGDDFGDFENEFQQGKQEAETSFEKPPDPSHVSAPPRGPPVLNFAELRSLEDIITATEPYIDEIYPSMQNVPNISTHFEAARSIFLSERSHSLWSQLVAPPPLQPPDWVRSRIRRLFLVSLGVPVDLDEILPASKQKKLILPSINVSGERSPRPSTDGRNGALGRVKLENASTASVNSTTSKPDRKRKGPPPPPELDISSTSRLCATTDAALQGCSNEELKAHIEQLKHLQERAKEVFDYWQKRMESALGDKDAFEQVIESLVAHAKKLR